MWKPRHIIAQRKLKIHVCVGRKIIRPCFTSVPFSLFGFSLSCITQTLDLFIYFSIFSPPLYIFHSQLSISISVQSLLPWSPSNSIWVCLLPLALSIQFTIWVFLPLFSFLNSFIFHQDFYLGSISLPEFLPFLLVFFLGFSLFQLLSSLFSLSMI